MSNAYTLERTPTMKPAFARHETFHPRYGWLKKAVDMTASNPELFSQPDAPVQLGVGKNMVTAIRYWAQAFKLIEEIEITGKSRAYRPTQLGQNLLGSAGWDPFLEDKGSLWLLHWWLIQPPCLATTWDFLFNEYHHSIFSQDDAFYHLSLYKNRAFPSTNVVESSLKKDLHCLTRMYAIEKTAGKQVAEDSISSPFCELGLLQHIRSHHYQFHIGYKASLPALIVAYACADYVAQVSQGRTIKIEHILSGKGSPGLVFKLSSSSLYDYLEQVAHLSLGFKISGEHAGMMQLIFVDTPSQVAAHILSYYYQG